MFVKSLSELSQKRGGSAFRARLKNIDDRLVWFGFVHLPDHAAKFGISDVQGKIDLQTYRNLSSTPPPERKPGPIGGNQGPLTRPGTYERPEYFVPLFDTARSLDDLVATKLQDVRPESKLTLESVPLPSRAVEPDSVRALLAATELRESCVINYQSMTSALSRERIVCPHALVKASSRWHVRAFDFARKNFIDFTLSRVLSSSALVSQAPVPAELDDDWSGEVTVEFIAHPSLSDAQKIAVQHEFQMMDGCLKKTVRRALLFYLLDEMRLLTAVRRGDQELAKGISLWVNNLQQLSEELERMEIEG
jgi:hypothetical protein